MSDRVELAGRLRWERSQYASYAGKECPGCGEGTKVGDTVALPPKGTPRDSKDNVTWHWGCWADAQARASPKPAPAEAPPKASATPEGAPSPSASASPTPSTYSSYRKNDYIHVEVEFQSAERRALVHVTHELGNGGNTGLKEYPVQLEDEINRVEEMVVRKARLLFHESGMDKHLL